MNRQEGFTITELLVVSLIAAILLAIGVPSYRYVTNSSRMSSEINGLLGDIQYARAEAIKEGQSVALCVSSDGTTCSGSTHWQNGWIVFPDPTQGIAPVAGTILRQQTAFTGTNPDQLLPDSGISSISFNRDGFAQAALGAAFAPTTFTLHDKTSNTAWTRCLAVSIVGLAQTENHITVPSCT